jgi:hypothetical protein
MMRRGDFALCALRASSVSLAFAFGLAAAFAVCAVGPAQSQGNDSNQPTDYRLAAVAIAVDLTSAPPNASAMVEVRNTSAGPIRQVEVFEYAEALTSQIVYTDISSESIDSPEPLPDGLFSTPQIMSDGRGGPLRLVFTLSRDLPAAETTWIFVKPNPKAPPWLAVTQAGHEVAVKTPRFAQDVEALVVGFLTEPGRGIELEEGGSSGLASSISYEGAVLPAQVTDLNRLLGAALGLTHRQTEASLAAAAYFGQVEAKTTHTAKASFSQSGRPAPAAGDRNWIYAVAVLGAGGVIIAALLGLGRRSKSTGADV